MNFRLNLPLLFLVEGDVPFGQSSFALAILQYYETDLGEVLVVVDFICLKRGKLTILKCLGCSENVSYVRACPRRLLPMERGVRNNNEEGLL